VGGGQADIRWRNPTSERQQPPLSEGLTLCPDRLGQSCRTVLDGAQGATDAASFGTRSPALRRKQLQGTEGLDCSVGRTIRNTGRRSRGCSPEPGQPGFPSRQHASELEPKGKPGRGASPVAALFSQNPFAARPCHRQSREPSESILQFGLTAFAHCSESPTSFSSSHGVPGPTLYPTGRPRGR